ncbi:mRNA capping enzyme-domain-containing protein [Lactifluus volemus]|nr:mRNA capping enzyme-domain-containing protein [Lactifluus volemus]
MPSFDPVRDAVLNSPVTRSPTLPRHHPPPSTSAVSSPQNATTTPIAQPHRRATVAALLNDTPSSPSSSFHPPSLPVRASSLAHILHPNPPDDPPRFPSPEEKLSRVLSLARLSRIPSPSPLDSLFTPTIERASTLFTPTVEHRGPFFPTSPASVRSTLSRPSTSSSTSHRPPPSPAMPRPPAPPALSPTPQRPPSPPPKPKPLLYDPRRRTPAGSMHFYRTQLGTGTKRLAKRKRSPSYEPPDHQPPVKRSRDSGIVMDHYNARPEVGIEQRRDSQIIGLRSFNNWIKSVLITRFAHPALVSSTVTDGRGGRGALRGKVLDIGCGKGGDLNKWSKARIKEYIGFDIAAVSIDQARGRWDSLPRATRFDATFATLDCYTEPLTRGVPPARLVEPFDVVSMQFCMHYAFESIAKVRSMLQNVTRWLRPGGMFLLMRLDQVPANASDLSFGNSVYSIKFETSDPRPLYGHRYSFFLQDAVEDIPEYIVRWDPFVKLAAEYGLHLLYRKEFHEVFEEFQDHPEFKPLLQKMNVVDGNGETEMNDDQWEAANIYVAFAMEKR